MAKEHKASATDEKPVPTDKQYDGGGGMNTGVAIVGFLLCFLAGGLLMWGYDRNQMKKEGISADSTVAWSDDESPIPVNSKDPVWGSRTAPVTVVLFSDFQCPFCSRVETTIDQVKTTYGPDKVRIVWKNEPLPFHQNAKPAAEAAQGVMDMKGSEAFWKFHDTAFKNQQSLNEESYTKWAQAAGVTDVAKFKAGLASHKWGDKVEKDHAIAKQVGVNGTPASFVNGISLSGAQPFDKFKEVIDKELEKAQAKLKTGTAKDRIYVEMTKENRKNAKPPADDEDGDDKEDTKSVFKVPVGDSPVLGNPNALVTIIEFSDFQCPYCKRVEPTLKQIRDTYGDKVRIVWKNEPLPFHPRATPAANLTLEARAQKGVTGFWAAHDKLFDLQPKLEDADLEGAAKDLGLNVDKVKAAIKDNKYKKDIDADQDLADDMQASGTPHFFVNGRRLVGAQPFEKFKPIIDEEITKASALLAKGVAPAKLYEELIKEGKGAPEPEKKTFDMNNKDVKAAPFKGNANAKVTIVEFSDFQCPFCSRVEPQVADIMKNYGDKVKFVWMDKPLPMHPDAPLASEAAREAFKQKGNDGFWKMHDKLFANQQKIKREDLDGYAKDIGLDAGKFKAALDSHTHKDTVDAASKAGDGAGITGTPAFIINGYFVSGAQPYPKFRKIIERALAEAK
ncbi:MAG: thioredoxin domain-containing protein [Polyangiaceae bacterium]|nr:thioredoxin domain-containing protein [Polyangiaceae bacterium]